MAVEVALDVLHVLAEALQVVVNDRHCPRLLGAAAVGQRLECDRFQTIVLGRVHNKRWAYLCRKETPVAQSTANWACCLAESALLSCCCRLRLCNRPHRQLTRARIRRQSAGRTDAN